MPAGREGSPRRKTRRLPALVLTGLLLALPFVFADALLTALGRLVVDIRIPGEAGAAVDPGEPPLFGRRPVSTAALSSWRVGW